jgi:hypothetical protein
MSGERNTYKYEDKNIGYKDLVGKSEAKKPLGTCSIMIKKTSQAYVKMLWTGFVGNMLTCAKLCHAAQ